MIETMRLEGVYLKSFKTKKGEVMTKIATRTGIMTVMAAQSKGQDEVGALPFPCVVDMGMRNVEEIYSSFGDKVFRADVVSMHALVAPAEKQAKAA